jgi:hypothetical protein
VGRGLRPTFLPIDTPLQSLTDLATITPGIQSQFFPIALSPRLFLRCSPATRCRHHISVVCPPHLRRRSPPHLNQHAYNRPASADARSLARSPTTHSAPPRQATSTPKASPLKVRHRHLHLHTGRLCHPPRRWDASAPRRRDATSAPRCGRHSGLPRPNRTRC